MTRHNPFSDIKNDACKKGKFSFELQLLFSFRKSPFHLSVVKVKFFILMIYLHEQKIIGYS